MCMMCTPHTLSHICTSSQADTHARSEKGTTIAADEGGEVADIEHLAGPSKPETAGREATPPAAHPEKSPEVIGPMVKTAILTTVISGARASHGRDAWTRSIWGVLVRAGIEGDLNGTNLKLMPMR